MNSYIFIFTISSIVASLTYCSDDRNPNELTPLSQHGSPYMSKLDRKALRRDTRSLPIWDGCCKRNSKFVENMNKLTATHKTTDESRYAHFCSLIGIEQIIYSYGCTCENPCAYVATGLIATTAGSIALSIAACAGIFPAHTETIATFPAVASIPVGAIAACTTCDAVEKCYSNTADQLEYITTPEFWPVVSKRSLNNDYDYDHDHEPLGADWSGPDFD